MTEFKVRCYKTNSTGDSIGAEVVIYDGEDVIDKITLVDQTRLDELTSKLDNLDSTYISVRELKDILTNSLRKNTINATLFNGITSDKFLKIENIPNYTYTPKSHSSTTAEYGLGTNSVYGHVKTIDNLNSETFRNGEALSAKQGYVLDEKITDLKGSFSPTKIDSDEIRHSKWKLYKSGNVVSLHIVEWHANSQARDRYFPTNLKIPDNCLPPTKIYIDDVVVGSQHIVVHEDGGISAFISSGGNGVFHGQASWITMEE